MQWHGWSTIRLFKIDQLWLEKCYTVQQVQRSALLNQHTKPLIMLPQKIVGNVGCEKPMKRHAGVDATAVSDMCMPHKILSIDRWC